MDAAIALREIRITPFIGTYRIAIVIITLLTKSHA